MSDLIEVQLLVNTEHVDVVIGLLCDDLSIAGVETTNWTTVLPDKFKESGAFASIVLEDSVPEQSSEASLEEAASEYTGLRFWHPADKVSSLEQSVKTMKEDLSKRLSIDPVYDIRITPYENQPWMEMYRAHFKPFKVGSDVAIIPKWDDRALPDVPVRIILNPGMAFGTGLHPTTRLMIKALVKLRRLGFSPSTIMDLGCGSGILSVTALKLWPEAMLNALDSDADAVSVAGEHIELNRLMEPKQQGKLSDQELSNQELPEGDVFSKQPIVCCKTLGVDDLSIRADLVLANINPTVLLEHKDIVHSLLNQSSILLLSGILAPRAEEVQIAYAADCGLESRLSFEEDGWRALCFFRFDSGGNG